MAVLTVKKGGEGGRTLPYLERIRENTRRHFSWRAMPRLPRKRDTAVLLALCAGARGFWMAASAFAWVKRLGALHLTALPLGVMVEGIRPVTDPPGLFQDRIEKQQVFAVENILPKEAALYQLRPVKLSPGHKVEGNAPDDASRDNSGAICDAYAARDSRVQVVHFPENRGPSAARNEGIRRARGAYISFVDADDRAEPAASWQTKSWAANAVSFRSLAPLCT